MDRLYGTGALWNGFGDVVEIRDEIGAKMCANHPDLYEKVHSTADLPEIVHPDLNGDISVLESTSVTELVNGVSVRLIDASRATLVKYVTEELGMRILDGHTKPDILNFISNYAEIASLPPVSDVEEEPAAAPEPDPEPEKTRTEPTAEIEPAPKPRKPTPAEAPPPGLEFLEVTDMELQRQGINREPTLETKIELVRRSYNTPLTPRRFAMSLGLDPLAIFRYRKDLRKQGMTVNYAAMHEPESKPTGLAEVAF